MPGPADEPDRLLGVLAPCAPAGTVEGLTVVVASVELWRRKTIVRVVAEPPFEEDAVALDAAWTRELEAWAAGDRRGEPPRHRVEIALDATAVRLADDVRDAHPAGSSSRGGSGSEWEAAFHFDGGVSPDARTITVAVGSRDGGERVSGAADGLTLALSGDRVDRRLAARVGSPSAHVGRAQRLLAAMGVELAGAEVTQLVARLLAEADANRAEHDDDLRIERAMRDVADGRVGLIHSEPLVGRHELDPPARSVDEAAHRAVVAFAREVLARHRAAPLPLVAPQVPPSRPARDAFLVARIDRAIADATSPWVEDRIAAAALLRPLVGGRGRPLPRDRGPRAAEALARLRADPDPRVVEAATPPERPS
ncbi:hypothetical protein [Patulibacter sp. SYSU D01012]|uniref:hypothetical protein n=1 Tax=Patulibacter sp. SYSU D01012 TaxID=2817381 RepID=UPI001B308DF6|nr:hypothetical protein [Patulibacter sp. SYSU D01012]